MRRRFIAAAKHAVAARRCRWRKIDLPSFHFILAAYHLAENDLSYVSSLPLNGGSSLFCARQTFSDCRARSIRLEAAKIYGVMGLAFALSSLLRFLPAPSPPPGRQNVGFWPARRALLLSRLMITAAASRLHCPELH